ncbi:hypothetical protein LWC34_26565 [Kibdelosporangium philippinense]|uniref:WXG100 family type VII secretion target n=1 Tax=Kibdelosporangium philippinense TaxID=211113 RepID=A0ABS8ZHI7_9PSEU|nr:hypothetical protein [Kibdelosporangium philippinense]MCE7006370.1 hypothetical protein [Kibdelosporangium philippinense]
MSSPTYTFREADGIATMQAMQRASDNMTSYVEQLLASNRAQLELWDGESKNRFGTYEAEWRAGNAQCETSLKQAAKALADITEGYTAADKYAASIW